MKMALITYGRHIEQGIALYKEGYETEEEIRGFLDAMKEQVIDGILSLEDDLFE